jgi:UrcA family protein
MTTPDISTRAWRTPIWAAAVIGAMFCGALVFSEAVHAQGDTTAAPASSQEITVIAPEVVRATTGKTRSGLELNVISTRLEVSFADLDLAKPGDEAELQKRIRAAAREACLRLDHAAPVGKLYSEPPGCEANAAREPLALAELLAVAARAAN